ncbi:unnamed protein product [Paramecium octaurelia]|uniref:Uncharacterized protein n=1 Tax=Paramecium octaurelia TaxID=43137 RepID=A0A8S1TKB8_PAROT|nr:unnamed protein product [Paramecium octaurelia]
MSKQQKYREDIQYYNQFKRINILKILISQAIENMFIKDLIFSFSNN